MRVLALCAGIGGLELGLRIAVPSSRTVCYVEGEAYSGATIVARIRDKTLDDAPIWSDVETFDGRPWSEVVDCITAGYPCQPFSHAGHRKGPEDSRHLWPNIYRIVREVKPKWCFFENVPGHLSMGFEQVSDDLFSMGYGVAAGLFTSAEVGGDHKRERLYILANSDSEGLQGLRPWGKLGENPKEIQTAWRPWWEPTPTVCRSDDGIPDFVDRIRALGNAVHPLVAAYAWAVLSDSFQIR